MLFNDTTYLSVSWFSMRYSVLPSYLPIWLFYTLLVHTTPAVLLNLHAATLFRT